MAVPPPRDGTKALCMLLRHLRRKLSVSQFLFIYCVYYFLALKKYSIRKVSVSPFLFIHCVYYFLAIINIIDKKKTLRLALCFCKFCVLLHSHFVCGRVCCGRVCLWVNSLVTLSYPCRYSDMVPLFAKPVPVISMITNEVLDYVYESHSQRILHWNHELLSPVKVEE